MKNTLIIYLLFFSNSVIFSQTYIHKNYKRDLIYEFTEDSIFTKTIFPNNGFCGNGVYWKGIYKTSNDTLNLFYKDFIPEKTVLKKIVVEKKESKKEELIISGRIKDIDSKSTKSHFIKIDNRIYQVNFNGDFNVVIPNKDFKIDFYYTDKLISTNDIKITSKKFKKNFNYDLSISYSSMTEVVDNYIIKKKTSKFIKMKQLNEKEKLYKFVIKN